MFKKRYYVILGILVLGAILFLPIVIKKNIVKLAFAQVKEKKEEYVKEKTQSKGQIQLNEQTMLILQHVKKGENDLAIKLAKEYLTSNPNDITAINVLTEAYINKDDLSSAEDTVKRAIAIQPNNPWSCRLLVRIYRIKAAESPDVKSKNLTLALELTERCLASNPDDIWVLSEVAQIYSEQGDKVKANHMIDSALRIAPNDTYLISVKENINQKEKK